MTSTADIRNGAPPTLQAPPGVYALTPSHAQPVAELTARVRDCLAGGAVMLQLRLKHDDESLKRASAESLAQLCAEHQVPLVINDDAQLAVAVGAPAVHLGRDDANPEKIGRQFPHLALGVSCYNQIEVARRLAPHASYLAFGSFFSSPTKPAAVRAHMGLLSDSQHLGRPLVAIGGLRADRCAPLIAAGARWLAVSSEIFAAVDVAAATAAFQDLFGNQEPAATC